VLDNKWLAERAAEIGEEFSRDATPARAVDAIRGSMDS
jgi:hypothetical protein